MQHLFHVVNAFIGTNGQNSWGYMFWSGFGFTLSWWFGLAMYYRKNKCHKCWRFGHHVAHYHYPICKRHKLLFEQQWSARGV